MLLSSDLDFAAFIERVDGRDLSYLSSAPSWARLRLAAYDAETDALRGKRITYRDARPAKQRQRRNPSKPVEPTFTNQQIEIALRAMEKRTA